MDLWNKRWKEVNTCYTELQIEIEKTRPFYPNTLYQQFHQLLRESWQEMIDFRRSLDKKDWTIDPYSYEKSIRNIDRFLNSLNLVCDLMRTRITES